MSTIIEKLQVNKNRLYSLLSYANEKTGVNDVSISDAIKTLCDGYGNGDSNSEFLIPINAEKAVSTQINADIVQGLANINELPFNVIYDLYGISTSNNSCIIASNASYITSLTPFDDGEISKVIVTMGDTDITNEVYTDGVINIPIVIGDIVITAYDYTYTKPVYNFDGKINDGISWTDTINGQSMTSSKGSFSFENNALIIDSENLFKIPTAYGSYGTFEVLVKISESFNPVNDSKWYRCSCIFGNELPGIQKDWGIIIDKNGYFAIGYAESSIASSSVRANDGQWHTLCLIVDINKKKLYIDGTLAVSVDNTMSGTDITKFGVGYNGDSSSFATAITGHIGRIKIFNACIPEFLVSVNYNNNLEWINS